MSQKKLPLGDISVNFVNSVAATLKQLKTPHAELLDYFSLTPAFLNTPDARISIPRFMRLGHEAIRLSRTPHFGLIMGTNMRVSDVGLAGFAAMVAPNLETSLQTLIEFETLSSRNSRGHSRCYMQDQRLVSEFYSISPYNQYNYFVVDSMLSTWFEISLWLTGRADLLHHVEVEYSNQHYIDAYESRFQCPVYFGRHRNALVFKKGAERSPVRYANQANFITMRTLCAQERERLTKVQTHKDRVTELIGTLLTGSPPKIEDIAEKMGMAGWTLRRRLKEEGVKYHLILDETREALAKTYVADTNHNFTEIAFLLGFSSPAAFQRAFKRWTGLSPGEYRRQQ